MAQFATYIFVPSTEGRKHISVAVYAIMTWLSSVLYLLFNRFSAHFLPRFKRQLAGLINLIHH